MMGAVYSSGETPMTRIRSAAWPATSLLVFGLLLLPVTPALVTTASAQGVTTAAITGVVALGQVRLQQGVWFPAHVENGKLRPGRFE